MTFNDVTKNEKAISGALALATHLLFLALLVFSVSWQQKKPDSAVIVDLWNNLPPLPQPKVEEPAPEAKPVPEPPKPVIKPDIALKEKAKLEKARREREIEAKKREDEKKKQAALKAQQDKLDKAKLEKEREEQLRKVLEKEAAQTAAAAHARLLDEYKRRVSERIKRFIVLPPNIPGNPEAQFEVVQIPGGEILSVTLKRSSGVAAYDGAVERAILKAQPLPAPPDAARFNEVRELELKFRPKE